MLPVSPPIIPMLARPQEEIPVGPGWTYEPKWDGFRAIVFHDEDGSIHLGSRKTQPLQRYFPEVVAGLQGALSGPAVLDGEIIIAGENGLDFGALQLRLHPAESRVRRLAAETPARFVAFDLLGAGNEDLRDSPFGERRRRLEAVLRTNEVVALTPQTTDAAEAAMWFEQYEGAGCDGIIAKRDDIPYVAGERVMIKIKHHRTADCVVAGYRAYAKGPGVGSLLLGLYDDEGRLNYVGHTSSFSESERVDVFELLQPLAGRPSFAADRSPGGPSRWKGAEESQWFSVEPALVCEVRFDYLQGPRFRHATRFLRWRPDRDPLTCGYDQLVPPHPFALDRILVR